MNKEKILNILIGLVVVASIALGYYYLFFESTDNDETVAQDASMGDNFVIVNNRILSAAYVTSLTNKLSQINLDRTHIDSAPFKSLHDITVPIIPEPVGVKMPFGKL